MTGQVNMVSLSLLLLLLVHSAANDSLDILIKRMTERLMKSKAEDLRRRSLEIPFSSLKKSTARNDSASPLVFLHGMGDSCFNPGMKSITEESGDYMNVYSTCIPTGDTWLADTLNGFLLSMDANVDVFAEKVKGDPMLANGFNCIGFSQGNNICRGYIQKYNDPPVTTHLSVHGPVVGVASLPDCDPSNIHIGDLCIEVDDVLAEFAYNEKIQSFFFQANYFRDVSYVNTTDYMEYSQVRTKLTLKKLLKTPKLTLKTPAHAQIGAWNNEGTEVSITDKENFGKTQRFAMIKAMGDTVVIPNEGEWWGAYDTDFETILTMKETVWYRDDLFGLKTADEAGKIFLNSTTGNHLEFTEDELFGWLDQYCL